MMEIYFGHEDGWKSSPRGFIRVEPHVWLRAKGTAGNLRKILKLSAESDRWYGTETLAEWENAVRDNYQEDKEIELRELPNAEPAHTGRLRAAVHWRDEHLRREEERFRRAKVHRGKSHAERVQEIEERYSRMLADEEKHYPRELETIRKRAARRRELAAAQLDAVRSFAEGIVRDGLSVEWIAHMQAYRIYHAVFPAQTVAYEDTLAAFYERTVV